MQRKRNSILLIIIILLLFTSCNEVNPINMFMQKFTSVFVKDNNVPVKTSESNISSTLLLAQNDNNKDKEKNVESASSNEDTTDIVSDSIINATFVTEKYVYKSKYRRDPFISVLELQREGMEQLELETASYFGMLKGKNGKMALFKDATGLGYVFYEGQKVKNGVLLKIEPDSVIFKINEFGNVRTKVIKIVKNERINKK